VQPVAEPRVVQRAQTLWDAPAVLALLAALLVAEWILRKQRGLT
jgi:cytochrome c-type biogenesis protein CcmH/NrfF